MNKIRTELQKLNNYDKATFRNITEQTSLVNTFKKIYEDAHTATDKRKVRNMLYSLKDLVSEDILDKLWSKVIGIDEWSDAQYENYFKSDAYKKMLGSIEIPNYVSI